MIIKAQRNSTNIVETQVRLLQVDSFDCVAVLTIDWNHYRKHAFGVRLPDPTALRKLMSVAGFRQEFAIVTLPSSD